jgi:hypothetical protein
MLGYGVLATCACACASRAEDGHQREASYSDRSEKFSLHRSLLICGILFQLPARLPSHSFFSVPRSGIG